MTSIKLSRFASLALFFVVASASLSGAVLAATSTISVSKAGSGSGTVSSNVAPINCGPTCTGTYTDGTVITLTATAAVGSQFTGWLGPCTGVSTCQFTVNGSTTVSATFALNAIGAPNIDVDVSTSYDALTDGLLLIRYLSGWSGASLINGVVASSATRTSSTEIFNYLTDIKPALDIDGNGQAQASTDGVLIIRYLFGLRGVSLIAGVVGTGAIRTSPTEIEAQIKQLMGGGQIITFTSIAPCAFVNGATYNVTATATSGLPVAFSIAAPASSVCSIAGSTVSFTGAGMCVINANQAGNATYNAAPQVQQSFPVAPAAGGGTCYTTNFPSTENPISESGNWINGKVVGLVWQNIATTPGFAFLTAGNPTNYDDSMALLTGTWGPDQYVRATVKRPTLDPTYFQEFEIRLRSTLTANSSTGYEINGGGQIVRWNGPRGDFTVLPDQGPYGLLNDGDVFEASIVGNVISVYINGVKVNGVTDSTYSSGNPGMGFFTRNPSPAPFGFSNFRASNFP